MTRNLCKKVLESGGKLIPLIIPSKDSKGLGLMNPSILLDQTKILLNLRNINYTLYHSENNQCFNNRWGPLVYLNPENDLHLRTFNFYCELDPNSLNIVKHYPIDTSTFDKPPVWEFVGLEDIRLVRWEGKLFGCGVRRDTKPNGEGRMELSELIEVDPRILKPGESPIKEISRSRIEPPGKPTYCEKNWMPILDMPYHFVKWCNPTEVVKVNPATKSSQTVFLGKSHIPNLPDFRGGSQVINYKNYRMCVIHEVNLFNNKLEQKDATYMHRFVVWDKEWNIVKISESFSFMDGEIEFSCGMALYKKDLLISFGFQDNAAYILKVPEKIIDEIIGFKKHEFQWGNIKKDKQLQEKLNKQYFVDNIYQKKFSVEKGDIVIDIGAGVGGFTYNVLNNRPKKVFCIEGDKEFFNTLVKNTRNDSVIYINKNINYNFKDDSLTFNSLLKNYNISKIDFLKINNDQFNNDIFTKENIEWIKNNVRKIVIEFNPNKFKIYNKKDLKQTISDYLQLDITKFDILTSEGKEIEFENEFLYNTNSAIIYINNNKIENSTNDKVVINNVVSQEVREYVTSREISGKKTTPNKWKAVDYPTLEITTNILSKGCIVDCVFCPQQVLINSYKGERIMSLNNFKKAIDKVPKEVTIMFSGFSEPWLNRQCTDMVVYANEKGHPISIFTIGVGMNKEDIDILKNITFSKDPKPSSKRTKNYVVSNFGFKLHIPDNEGYSKHPITEKYIEILEYINSISKSINNFEVTCMGTPHEKIKHIFSKVKYPTMWSRANNLLKEKDLKPELMKLKDNYRVIFQGTEDITCNCNEKLYHNVLLPNGDIVLCCMDYELEHRLGNLYEQEYNDIIPEENIPFELCRFCENGISLKK